MSPHATDPGPTLARLQADRTMITAPAPRPAYVWSRHFSSEQGDLLLDLARTRCRLDPAIAEASRFARVQPLLRRPRWPSTRVNARWQGELVDIDVEVEPLLHRFALRLYEEAFKIAVATFPGFTDCTFEDGPDIGERRLRFTNRSAGLAAPFLWTEVWDLAKRNVVQLGECQEATPVESCHNRIRLRLSLDLPFVDEVTCKAIAEKIARGDLVKLDPRPRSCDPIAVRELLTELTLPELVRLNWDVARKMPTPLDQRLLKAAGRSDPEAIHELLAQGADPNALDEYGYSVIHDVANVPPLMSVSAVDDPRIREGWQLVPFERTKACLDALLAAGASLDAAGPQGFTPLVEAVLWKHEELVIYLLEHGADDTIDAFQDYLGEWPAAWEYASADCTAEPGEASERTYAALARLRQAPDGTGPGRPE